MHTYITNYNTKCYEYNTKASIYVLIHWTVKLLTLYSPSDHGIKASGNNHYVLVRMRLFLLHSDRDNFSDDNHDRNCLVLALAFTATSFPEHSPWLGEAEK